MRFRSRRVVVKARVVKLNPQRGSRGPTMRGTAAKAVDAHLRYLERDGVTSNGEKGRAYSADENEADGRSGQSGQGWSTNTRRLNHPKRRQMSMRQTC